ncbi:MAG TPA: radical SAM protein, partial [Candidatus Faecousia faecipullorum]|nr:radical SAM protein [Candidatus Faecousia faecipullorum]
MSETMKTIFEKADRGDDLTKADAVALLQTQNLSEDYYSLLCKANTLALRENGKHGYIFAQIGLNSAPCSGNCKFCPMACDNFAVEEETEKSEEEIMKTAKNAASQGIDA